MDRVRTVNHIQLRIGRQMDINPETVSNSYSSLDLYTFLMHILYNSSHDVFRMMVVFKWSVLRLMLR